MADREAFDPKARYADPKEELAIGLLKLSFDSLESLGLDPQQVAAILGSTVGNLLACDDDVMNHEPEKYIDLDAVKAAGAPMPPKGLLRLSFLENFEFAYKQHIAKHDKSREGLKAADHQLNKVCESHKISTAKRDPSKFTEPKKEV